MQSPTFKPIVTRLTTTTPPATRRADTSLTGSGKENNLVRGAVTGVIVVVVPVPVWRIPLVSLYTA